MNAAERRLDLIGPIGKTLTADIPCSWELTGGFAPVWCGWGTIPGVLDAAKVPGGTWPDRPSASA